MTTALGYVVTGIGKGEKFTLETLALARTEFEALRAIESAASLYVEKPNPRTRSLLRHALELLPSEVGA